MKRLFILATLLLASSIFSTYAFAYKYVDGYTRSDGTYVSGHYRDTSNDGNSYNNANTIGLNQ